MIACARPTAGELAPQPIESVPGLVLRSETRGCPDSSAVGDSVFAVITSGGDRLTPPQPPGTRAVFVITDVTVGRLPAEGIPGADAGGASLRIEPRLLLTAAGPREFRGPPAAFEYKFYAPADSARLYLCFAVGSQIFLEPEVLR